MEPFQTALILGLLAVGAHIIKGLTGFGPAIVFVSVGSIIHDPIEIIVLASLLDIIGGGYLSFLNPEFFKNKKYWIPIGSLMVVGAIIGSATLSLVPAAVFEYLLGTAIILISLWFLFGDADPDDNPEGSQELGALDGIVGAFSGFCGGFTGMGGPPLIVYLGTKFRKTLFRAVIVPIFLMAAIARFSTYGVLGLIDTSNFWMYIFPPVGVILGNTVGDRLFDHVEQRWFTVLIGIILLLSGARVILN
jgi:Predicted permeases